MKHGGKRVGAGRKPGSVSSHCEGSPLSPREGIQAFAKSIVEDPQVQDRLLDQARQGMLPVPLVQMFFHYAYGKPTDQQTDDHALMADLLSVVLKYVDSREGQQEIHGILEKHAAGPPGLRAVA